MKNKLKKVLSFLTILVMFVASCMNVNAANTIINTSQVPNLYPKEPLSESEISSLREKNWTNGETFSGNFTFIENMSNYNGHESFKVSLTSGKAGSVKNARAYCLIHNAKSDFTHNSTGKYQASVKVTEKAETSNYVKTTTQTIRVIVRCDPPGGKRRANETSGSGWQDMGFWFQFTKISTENLEKPKFSLKIRKQADASDGKITDSNLSGAVYSVREESASGKEVATITTDRNGNGISKTKIEEGSYYLVETKAPSNAKFQLNSTPVHVDLKESTAEKTYEVKDVISSGRIRIEKKDENNSPLNGVEFGVYSDEDTFEYRKGDLVERITTDEKGIAVTGKIQLGKYYVKEIHTIDGYRLSSENIKVELSSHDTTETVSVVNERLPIRIHTTATVNGSKVVPVSHNTIINDQVKTYDLVKDRTYTLKAMLIDQQENKPIIINGSYVTATKSFISEGGDETTDVKIPFDSYALSGKKVVVYEYLYEEGKLVAQHTDIKDAGQTIEFEKLMTSVSVRKVDSITKEVIKSKSFAFTIYSDKECTKEIKTVNANTEDGTATFTDVEYGTYFIKETKAPVGYELSDEVKKVVVDENLEHVGETYTFEYMNTPLPAAGAKTSKAAVQTGDETDLLFIMVLLCSSIITLLVVWYIVAKRTV